MIRLTQFEKEWVRWAIDPMEDYFNELLEEGEIDQLPSVFPTIEENVLHLPNNCDILEDLLFRVGDLAIDMVEEGTWEELYKESDEMIKREIASRTKKLERLAGKIERYRECK